MSEVTIEFNGAVTAIDSGGITATVGDPVVTKTFAPDPGAPAGSDTSVLTYTGTWTPALAAGDVVTVHYSSLGNTLMDSVGKRLQDLEDVARNCLDPAPDDGYFIIQADSAGYILQVGSTDRILQV